MESLILSGNIILCLHNMNFFEKVESFVDSLEDTINTYVDNVKKYIVDIDDEDDDVESVNSIIEEIDVEEMDEMENDILEEISINDKIDKINLNKLEIFKNSKKYDIVMKELIIKHGMKSKLTPTQIIISKTLKNKKCLIIYLGLFYDFVEDKWDKLELLKEIIHTSIKMKIPVVLIGENNPINFIPKLNNALSVYFSNSNYITPYHYKSRWFDTPKRIENNKVSMKPCKVSLIQMINDIIDQYQLDDEVYTIIKFTDINFG